MNWFGIAIGISTLFIIGLGFVWVIRGERYFGYLWWPYVMGAGIMFVIGSLVIPDYFLSALIGALGGSMIWGSTELKEQAIRGELGWYPFQDKKILPPFANVIKKWQSAHETARLPVYFYCHCSVSAFVSCAGVSDFDAYKSHS
jgi:hypothetical protein